MASFEISKATTRLLDNFAGVSNSILLTEGKQQRTLAAGKSVLAIADLPEAWPRPTGIYDLGGFLRTLSLFDSPQVQFNDDAMLISQGRSRMKYRYSDPSTIQTVTAKELEKLTKDNPAVEFALPEAVLALLKKACALQDLSDVTIDVADEIIVRATSEKNPSSNAFEHVVENAKRYNPTFQRKLTVKREHVDMLLPGNYTVALSTWKWAYVTHATEPVKYFVVGKA